jgi:hypothetical protein
MQSLHSLGLGGFTSISVSSLSSVLARGEYKRSVWFKEKKGKED